MSDDDHTGGGGKGWLWSILGVVALVIGLLVLIGLSAVLIKWGIIALLVYGAFVLARRLLGKSSSEQSSAPKLLPEADRSSDPLALLEQERELDKLKARMGDDGD
ncbi:hypothetical protein FIV42_17950 [Persicimonas caeni]|uniref:Uncharacterized protein n=1 Tax=Persicimonas caeni TaxID=2292766 RepID=A0A4Y6PWN9_PERCE|nr:SdpI family protein [Persicimonas caeni]QDG52549.1 hypothetical protein FIV42_17950 [Persicimonas caeni]QED33771.1 hypothetical protein FRD00_17945 [Persicimonas caeni]